MKTVTTTLISIIALAGVSGTALAGEGEFKAAFNYDAAAPVSDTYANFTADAKDMCNREALRAGYRLTEISSWQQRQCVKQLVSRAVKATKSKSLIAFHNSGGQSLADHSKFASTK